MCEMNQLTEHIVPVTDSNADVIFYCSSDSLFDVLYDTHLSIGHNLN
jgi:hypothetical protein